MRCAPAPAPPAPAFASYSTSSQQPNEQRPDRFVIYGAMKRMQQPTSHDMMVSQAALPPQPSH